MISFSGLRDLVVDFLRPPSSRFIGLVEEAFGPMALRREMKVTRVLREGLLEEVTYASATHALVFGFDVRDMDVDCRYGPASSLRESGAVAWPEFDAFVSISWRLRRLGVKVPQGYDELIKRKRFTEAVALLVSGLERFETEIFSPD